MELPPRPRHIPGKSKKRVSTFMDPDVVEIVNPITSRISNSNFNSKLIKKNEVILHEVVDVDMAEPDVMVTDEKVHSRDKGKAIKNDTYGYSINGLTIIPHEIIDVDMDEPDIVVLEDKGKAKTNYKEAVVNDYFTPSSTTNFGLVEGVHSSQNFATGSPQSINFDGVNPDMSSDDEDYIDLLEIYEESENLTYDDHYRFIQGHFDNEDIPPGIEAPVPNWIPGPFHSAMSQATPTTAPLHVTPLPIAPLPSLPDPISQPPWLHEPSQMKQKSTSTSDPFSAHSIPHPLPSMGLHLAHHRSKMKSTSFKLVDFSSKVQESALKRALTGVVQPKLWWSQEPYSSNNPGITSSSNYASGNQSGGVKAYFYPSFPYFPGVPTPPKLFNSGVTPPLPPSSPWVNSPAFFGPVPKFNESMNAEFFDFEEQGDANFEAGGSTTPSEPLSDKNVEDILKNFTEFKQFDTVEDHSDHRYTKNGILRQQPKNWAKKIQDEWKMLEKGLPDAIYVRAYETRMDLLRAVIVGAEGTPYHDGLFFFDISFPDDYPNVPPRVHYRSGGLRLNPNLYNCGKVCLSLLNTWAGDMNERWIPGVSTMLQVLVSIQALILNANPYFNEPGYAHMSGSLGGEKKSQQYNENTFVLSLKTMLYAIRKPPKHFEDLVLGHFHTHGHDIMLACKAYTKGAEVGSLVKGRVQDVAEGPKSCSKMFIDNMTRAAGLLFKELKHIRAKDCDEFPLPNKAPGRSSSSSHHKPMQFTPFNY